MFLAMKLFLIVSEFLYGIVFGVIRGIQLIIQDEKLYYGHVYSQRFGWLKRLVLRREN